VTTSDHPTADPKRFPRRPRFRPELPPACLHCDRLGPSRYSVHVGGLCVRLVADHVDQREVVGGVTMRPVELTVNGEPRWVWTRLDVDAIDVDDMVAMFQAFEPRPPRARQRVVDGGSARRPEPVGLFASEPVPSPPPAEIPAEPPRLAPAMAFPVVAGLPAPAWL
jgi:hypothetical protein